MKAIFIALAVAMCAYRMVIQPGLDLKDIFKDASHLFVGGLIGASAAFFHCKDYFDCQGGVYRIIKDFAKFFGGIALAVTLFEVFCGVVGKQIGQPVINLF